MALDSITETIAHFVGTFEITMEQARLRDQYEEFTALKRKAELEDIEGPTTIRIKADLELAPGDYKPLPYKFSPEQPDLPFPPAPSGPISETVIYLDGVPVSERFIPDSAIGGPSASAELIILRPDTEPLGSAVTYTLQTLFMRDNDTVGEGDFRDTEALMATGEEMLDMALSLHAVAAPSFSLAEYKSIDAVEALAEQMLNPMNSDVEGVTVHQFHGEDALGVIVNGEHMSEAPVWNDLLPTYHQPEEETENELSNLLPAEWDQSDDPEFDAGHTVVAGGNLAINAVSATVAWVDAPFIAVGGQSISLTMISQVALVSDWDQGQAGTGSGTNIVQSSQIEVEANAAPWLVESTGEPGQPSFLTVDWVHGDLVVANFIKQVIDATDIDHIQTEISAASTLYAMGDNEMFNVTDIIQLGSFYDLIMIGGNMVSVDMLFQTIALMDDDIVTGGMSGTMAGEDENLVMNQASVNTIGEDFHEELQQNISSAMAMQEMDMAALEEALLNDPMFAGMEQMRVLKIDGDLLQVNIIEQVTMMLDQDDIFLSGPNAAQTQVIAGSNAMLNAASITKLGVDSTVMAGGGSYSDLLLHQASLIEMQESEDIAELTNEAIAILMEEAAGGQMGAPSGPQLSPAEQLNADDGLQTMLA
ncbi:type I secretion protein [Rhodobacteraceae bacterium B1Z28]|uniref:Type I secretion protein n=1 Tax=Ruegeria haliotis TaxID=2747601 RepID=A0ABX2PSN0_9RHOB|nr:type I secretion protein [Ruegeria haliotis]NVO57193.1 type I secretion protein [Ruegeria haliotis]